jgi:hypothetical protein
VKGQRNRKPSPDEPSLVLDGPEPPGVEAAGRAA